jgi:hypothetical protein
MVDAVIEGRGPEIVRLIAQIKREVGALAPSRSDGVPFPFRGIDGVVNHLVGKINEYGIVTVPQVIESKTTERAQGNRVVKTTDITVAFHFHAPDGSFLTATTQGLADDYADRSAAQAQSVAFRIALLQTFFLPTQSPEPEQTGQQVQDGATAQPQQPQAVARAAAGSATKPPTQKASALEEARAELKAVATEAAEKSEGALKPNFYIKLAEDKKLAKGWASRPGDLKVLAKAIQNGEVPGE